MRKLRFALGRPVASPGKTITSEPFTTAKSGISSSLNPPSVQVPTE